MLTTRLGYELFRKKPEKKLLNAARDSDDNVSALQAALEAGVTDINVRDMRTESEFNTIGWRYTALMWAAHRGHLEQVKFLVEKGADPSLVTGNNNTALHLAAREGHEHVADYLANKFSQLVVKKGEEGKLPHEMAKTYGPFRDVVGVLTGHYQKSIRALLPENLRECSWGAIFEFYFPHHPKPQDPFTDLIEKIRTVYWIGDKINMLEDKAGVSYLVETMLSLPFVIVHWVDFPSDKQYRKISNSDANIKSMITTHKEINVYRELTIASEQEYKDARLQGNLYHSMCKTRKPVVEIKMEEISSSFFSPSPHYKIPVKKIAPSSIESFRLADGSYSTVNEAEKRPLSRR